jgi:hypothetical protein
MNPFSFRFKRCLLASVRGSQLLPNLCLPGFLLFLLPSYAAAQPPVSRGLFEILAATDSLEVRITTNVDSLLTNKFLEGYLPGKFQFRSGVGAWREMQAGVGMRGKYRRTRCDFPLLRLGFDKEDLQAMGLNQFGDFRLMTQCSGSDSLARELLLKEMLVYRLHNEISETSFRVKWLQVTYVNEADGREVRQVGLLIEDVADLAYRTNTRPVDPLNVPQDSVSVEHDKISALFQFMIGNVEWGYKPGRNIEFLQQEGGMYVPVVYDFDYSGFVNAPYAKPKTHIGQKSMRERVYFGRKIPPQELAAAFPFFLGKENALKKLIRDYQELGPETRKDLESYVDEFFKLIPRGEEAATMLLSRKPWVNQPPAE